MSAVFIWNGGKTMVDQRYELLKMIGKGSGGTVYLAYDHKLQKEWAIKEIEGNYDYEKSMELNLLKSVSCSAFPRIVDVVYENHMTYVVMDYVEGESLRKMLMRGALREKEVIRIGIQLAEGLAYLHNMTPKMIYMDCKPDNIMMTPDGEIKLIDLGSAYIFKDYQTKDYNQAEDEKKPHRISGTKLYAPREQCLARGNQIDVATDVYAFGMTLCTLLLGKEISLKRQKHVNIREFHKGISFGMNYIIRKCLEVDERKRFQSMEEIIDCFKHIKRVGRREGCIANVVSVFLFLEQTVLTTATLYFAYQYSNTFQTQLLLYASITLVLLIIQCFHRKKEIWQLEKNVYLGRGKKILISIILIAAATLMLSISGMAKENSSKNHMLDVTLYDHEFRKILIRDGSFWEIEEDILLSISKEEIQNKEGKIVISYDADDMPVKQYLFLVKRE